MWQKFLKTGPMKVQSEHKGQIEIAMYSKLISAFMFDCFI